MRNRLLPALFGMVLIAACASGASAQRYVIADQDASGPGGSDMMSLLVFLQSPDVHLLGITVVTGDSWRDEEVAHALRLVEAVGRTDVKVYPGAAFPLVRTLDWTRLANKMYGAATFEGAFSDKRMEKPWDAIPPMREGPPSTKPADEDAAHFMVRMVHKYPHKVTIYAAGPLTNVALAIRLDPHFAELAQELVVMGGSINPNTKAAEWVNSPRHEFNFWFDPEAASIALEAPWAKITTTTIDVSLKTRPEPEVLDGIAKAHSPAAEYVTRYFQRPVFINYLWDELAAAAWIDPTLIKEERYVYMDVDTVRGPTYGDTLTWNEQTKPALPLHKVHAQMDVDLPRLQKFLVDVLSQPTPKVVPSTDELTK
ncbi:nucleoside hydrolase [Granulicella mallensis]|uniref:Inosine-uridine nucleoside N-ribohydrolase n=1 Tax=Granulicella mallensis TaxID=940614 RepID=A0A7W7ZVF3_9BACT|nr:nucleoside hydrolase [Granulicella mallensis]MBB5065951.1 inosine-uridine nucleoside N-ribohydrolase [Granulicella mallensis]